MASKKAEPKQVKNHISSEPLRLRPEDIVKCITENGELPKDFNPYGDYMPEQIVFLGEKKPTKTKFYVGVNEDDEDIIPVYVSTPTPPDLNLVDNYGLPVDEQYYRKLEMPIGLKKLEEKAFTAMYDVEKKNKQETVQGYRVYQKFWELLDENQTEYKEEIEWIKHIWWYRTNGYWFFNDGEPVYCTGEYFDYLQFWFIKDSETWVEYREEDRRISIFSHYLRTTTESFKNINPDTGRAVPNDDGTYDMVNIGSRVFFGDMKPKFRRCGETQWACHGIWQGCSTTPAAYGTIISMDGDNAEKHYYKKLIPSWNKYPLFLKPIWMGSKRPTSIKMIEPPNVYHIEGLGSSIDFTESGGSSKNDGDTLYFCLSDEEGKSKTPIAERWNVNKIAMSTGGGTNILRNAYAWHPSTVEDIGEGGMEYFKMWQLSSFYERIPIMGQTHSGLARIFIPAYKKLEGYIDRWGKSVIDSPTPRQIKYSPRAKFALTGKGAKETLEAVLNSLLAKGTPEALEAYRSRRRKFPIRSSDCWLGSSGSVGFDMGIMDKRLEEINRMRSFNKPPYKAGYFQRENGNLNDRVIWVDDADRAKFKMSMDIPDIMTNQREAYEVWDGLSQKIIPSWRPIRGDRFTLGADPFRNLKAQEAKLGAKFGGGMSNSRQSDGGIVVLWEHDPEIDKGTNRKEWESFRTVLTYRYRPPTQEEYFEDILMAAQYFGAMIYPEQNVDALVPYIYKRGYFGYCLFDIGMDGKQKPLPGRYNATETNQDMIRAAKDYIQFRGHVECHDDLLRECKSLRGIEDVTHKDIFAAFGMALLGSKSRYRELISMGEADSFDIDGLF
jgi:hypothetical protein